MNIDGAVVIGGGVAPGAAAVLPLGDEVAAVFSALLAAAVPVIGPVAAKGLSVAVPGTVPRGVVDPMIADGSILRNAQRAVVDARVERAGDGVPRDAGPAFRQSALPPDRLVVVGTGVPGFDVAMGSPVTIDRPAAAKVDKPLNVQSSKPLSDLPARVPAVPAAPDNAVPPAVVVTPTAVMPRVDYATPAARLDYLQLTAASPPAGDGRLPLRVEIVADIATPRMKVASRSQAAETPVPGDDDEPADAAAIAEAVVALPAALPPIALTATALPVARPVGVEVLADRPVSGKDLCTAVITVPVKLQPVARSAAAVEVAVLPDLAPADASTEIKIDRTVLVPSKDSKPTLIAEKPVVVQIVASSPEAMPRIVPPQGPVPVAPLVAVPVPAEPTVDWRLRREDRADVAVPVAVADAGVRLAPLVMADAPVVAKRVPIAEARSEIAVASENLGDVRIGIAGTSRDLKVSLGLPQGLAAGMAALVAADVPRLVADLAANGVRLQSLDVSSGGQFGSSPQHQRESPGQSPARQTPVFSALAAPRARDRFA